MKVTFLVGMIALFLFNMSSAFALQLTCLGKDDFGDFSIEMSFVDTSSADLWGSVNVFKGSEPYLISDNAVLDDFRVVQARGYLVGDFEPALCVIHLADDMRSAEATMVLSSGILGSVPFGKYTCSKP